MTASARRGAPSPVYAAVLLFSAVATAALTYFVGRFVFGGKAWIALALPLIFLPLIAIEAALVFLRPAHKSAARMTFEGERRRRACGGGGRRAKRMSEGESKRKKERGENGTKHRG